MKCPNCAAELVLENNVLVCKFCNSTFLREEFIPREEIARSYRINGGVLLAYIGNQEEVIIPRGVVAIGKEAFKNNLVVKKVVFATTVKTIDKSAFEGCANLTEIENYNNIEKIDNDAFKFCGLKEVTIGENINFLGNGCFSRMPNLEKVIYDPKKNLKLSHTFAYCSKLEDVEETVDNFFPSFHTFFEVKNNPDNKRPTYGDAFPSTPYHDLVLNKFNELYKEGICPECGGKIKKGLFHSKCENCGIDYKN